MTAGFVVDASVAIAWVHPAQATSETAAMLDALAAGAMVEVPALWPLEVASALTLLARRRKLSAEDRDAALTSLAALPVRIDHEAAPLAFTRLALLAAAHGLSVYDAVYLELSLRRRLPLACLDGPLRKAAAQAGATLWHP